MAQHQRRGRRHGEVRALHAGVEQPDQCLFVFRAGRADELHELGVGVCRIGTVAEQVRQRVEVVGVELRADLVDPLQVVRDAPEAGELVVVAVSSSGRAHAVDHVPQRRRVSRRPRLGDLDGVERVASDLRDRLERPARAVHVPREVRDPVGARNRIGERWADRHDRQRVVEDGLVLDDVVVDRHSGDGFVAVGELREITEVLERVADAEGSEVHHRITHVRVLEVEQPGDAPLVEHELERVVGDEARRGEPVLGHVFAQPTPQEHLDRIGRLPFGTGVVEVLHPSEECELGRRGVGRDREPRRVRRHERDGVDAGQHLEVLLEHLVALGVVGGTREVDQARQAVHDQRVRVVAQAVRMRHREAVRLQQVVHRDLVGDAIRHRDARFAVTARVQRQHATVDLDVDVPRRSPPGDGLDPGHGPAHGALDP